MESAYKTALAFELIAAGLDVKTEIPLPMIYEGVKTNNGYRMDMLVNDKVIIEIKSIEAIQDVHHKQVLTYLNFQA